MTPSLLVSSTPSGGLVVVRIFDERGELVATVNGSGAFANTTSFAMALSAFEPNSNGSGGSISILLNGQVIALWTAIDSNGNMVPNGFYHLSIIETGNNGSVIQLGRVAYIETNHGGAVQLLVMPNIGRIGQTIQIAASFAGLPADQQSAIKIYTIAGERILTLSIHSGSASWNLTNNNGQPVAAGLYLVVLDGVDPVSGQSLRKTEKLLILH
jgi:hypothetical protein